MRLQALMGGEASGECRRSTRRSCTGRHRQAQRQRTPHLFAFFACSSAFLAEAGGAAARGDQSCAGASAECAMAALLLARSRAGAATGARDRVSKRDAELITAGRRRAALAAGCSCYQCERMTWRRPLECSSPCTPSTSVFHRLLGCTRSTWSRELEVAKDGARVVEPLELHDTLSTVPDDRASLPMITCK